MEANTDDDSRWKGQSTLPRKSEADMTAQIKDREREKMAVGMVMRGCLFTSSTDVLHAICVLGAEFYLLGMQE